MHDLPVVMSQDHNNLATPDQLGGKACHLFRLIDLGLAVPPFFVVSATSARIFAQAVTDSPGQTKSNDANRRAREMYQAAQEIERAILAAYHQMNLDQSPVAVRSSAATEDGGQQSFAGIFESLLGICDAEAVLTAIQTVYASSEKERVVAYLKLNHLDVPTHQMGVIVQRMIEAAVSGVCFTNHPVTGDTRQIVINSLFGLGEGLVRHDLSSDSYTVNKDSLDVTSQLIEKSERFIFDTAIGGVCRVAVPEEHRRDSSLSPDQIRRLSVAALKIEAEFGCPQDIEFCFSGDDELFILQTRPITAMFAGSTSQRQNSPSGNHIIWDNSNIIESYSGVTTPMTFSFIRRAYAIVYHCFAEVMGISPRTVHQHREVFNNMLGLFHGRVYYNLRNWYQLVKLFPGFRYNAQFMESMMGLKEPLLLEEDVKPIGVFQRWFIEFPALMKLLLRSSWNFIRIRHKVDAFHQHFYNHYNEWTQIDFDQLPPHEVRSRYNMMEEKLLWNWQTPIINDFFVMVFYGVLRKLCVSWCDDKAGTLQNGLICGEGGLQSDEPAKLILQMSAIAAQNPQLREMISSDRERPLHQQISSDDNFQEFNLLMERYLHEYGLRCPNELKLESPSYRDQPDLVYELVRQYLQSRESSAYSLNSIIERERSIRRKAEAECMEKLREARSWIPRQLLFRWVLHNARMGIRNRENMRFARTRIYGILRKMLRSIGSHFAEEGLIDQSDDIFYLTLDEVWDFIKGTAVTTDLRGLVSLRRSEFDGYRQAINGIPADRFETFGTACHGNDLRGECKPAPIELSATLTGIGCCPGIVTGCVQVISDPLECREFCGDILVANRTDPGWVSIYPAFSGILVERGSALSHSAIIAREMGIPTIVGISDLTSRVGTGQRIRMDGSSGEIQILQ